MVADEEGDIVGRGVPARLTGHLIIDCTAIDLQSFEGDVPDFTLLIVAVDDRHIRQSSARCVYERRMAAVPDIAEGDVFHAKPRGLAVFLVPTHLHVQETSLTEAFDTDIVEKDVANKVIVACVDGQAALVVHLRFALAEDIEILVSKVLDGITTLRVRSCCGSVQPDKDGMCHIGPERGVTHVDVACRAFETFTGGIDCGTVIAVAAKDTVVEDI